MSKQLKLNLGTAAQAAVAIERRYTRDAKVPLSADDPDCENGWRCIPIPPTADDGWVIFDTSKDYKTGWMRSRLAPHGPPCTSRT